jgi:hypothetical protein
MNTKNRLNVRFRIEMGLAILTTALFILTLISREWIEALTGFDPDRHNGSFEWFIVAALFSIFVVLFTRARSDWRKVQALPA